jgi:putative acetyltransferase
MYATSQAESVHALNPAELAQPGLTFHTVRRDGLVVACGALKELSSAECELKSMRTAQSERGRGVASALLAHLLEVARERGYRFMRLETGAEPYFEPARRLYARHGFAVSAPFADYWDDPHSVFMSLEL